MSSSRPVTVVLTILRVALGLMWIYAGILKVADPAESLLAVRAYQILPEWAVVVFGYALPVFEIALGVLLVLGLATRVAATVSGLVMAAFMIVIGTAWARDLQIECGCFGDGGFSAAPSYLEDLVRDGILLLVSVAVAVWPRSPWSLDQRVMQPGRGLRVGLGALLALGLLSGLGLGVEVIVHGTDDPTADVPQGLTGPYGVREGPAGAPVEVTVFEDFMCSFCAELERHVDALLDTAADDGDVEVLYRPVALLDRLSTDEFSTRALNAAACALDLGGPTAFASMHDDLFSLQPAAGSPGLSDAQLADLAVAAGASRSAVTTCIDERRFAGWVQRASAAAVDEGVQILPVVLVNGDRVTFTDTEVPEVTLQRVIDEALARR